MIHIQENLFELDYDNNGTIKGIKGFDKNLPAREPDATEVQDVRLTHTGKEPCQYIKLWFAEGRAADVNHYYDDDEDVNSLKTNVYPGVCQICPNTGHLIYIHENSRRWEYANKKTQDAFVNWVTEQALVANEETEGNSP